jgi:hypothetical protein
MFLDQAIFLTISIVVFTLLFLLFLDFVISFIKK